MPIPEREGATLTGPDGVDRAAVLPEDAVVIRLVDQAESPPYSTQKALTESVKLEAEMTSDAADLHRSDPHVTLYPAAVATPRAGEAEAVLVPG